MSIQNFLKNRREIKEKWLKIKEHQEEIIKIKLEISELRLENETILNTLDKKHKP